ncbi:MAG TPA: rhomboid family intramembrane serine protease [Thermoanaerobaculia bacterium]|nr:rhomboid family intramembrane serine protease [Thermoanaerobaculia bacterium]
MKTVLFIVVAVAAAAFVPGEWLELVRGGAPWRLVTCHLTHWTHEQLAWDGVAFVALALVCARRNRAAFQATLLASALVIPVAVFSFTDLAAYRGLSGVASAVFALLLTLESRRSWPVALCAAGFAAKLIFEVVAGAALFVNDMGPGVIPVPVAHLSGAITGALIGITSTIRPCASQSPCSSL